MVALVPIVIETSEDFTQQTAVGPGILKLIRDPADTLDPAMGRAIAERGDKRVLKHAGVSVLARTSEDFPNPTLAHFFLGQYLAGQPFESFVDFGCGSGFLGNLVAARTNARHVVFADMSTNAMGHALGSYELNHDVDIVSAPWQPIPFGQRFVDDGRTIDAILGPVQQTLPAQQRMFGIAGCAPYFLPAICEVFPQAYELFARTAREVGATLYVGHSSLATPEVQSAAFAAEMHADVVARKDTVRLHLEYADGTERSRRQRDSGLLLPESERELIHRGMQIVRTDGSSLPTYYHDLVVTQLRK